MYERYGPPEVLTLGEVPKPEPRENEVRIAIAATTVTAACGMMRRGDSAMARLVLGFFRPRRKFRVPGIELCGRVDQILQPAVENDHFSTIAALAGHAEHVVTHSNQRGIVSAQLAALHGNLALCFSKHGRFDDSIPLLEHELEILEEITGDNPVAMTLQTHLQLANTLIDAGRPFEEILARITQTIDVTEYFEPSNPYQKRALFTQWANLRSMVGALRRHQNDPRVIALRTRIDRAGNQLPARSGDAGTDNRIDWIAEIAELNNLLDSGGHEREVIPRARNAFNACTIHDAKIHLLGLELEAHAYLGNTGSIINGL